MKVKKPAILKKLRESQEGFTLIELLLVLALTGIISTAAAMSIHQVIAGTALSNDQNTAINQVRNAGHWISRDALMAQYIYVDSDPEAFLTLKWTKYSYNGGDDEYHTIVYSLQDMSDGIGELKRTHYVGTSVTTEQFIADHIYYQPGEADSTAADYISPVLTVRITAKAGDAVETRQYEITRRPNF